MLEEEKLTIEDLILCLSSIKPIDGHLELPVLEKPDYNLINSFGRQIVRNIGFTDRQYELAKRKVDDYADYFKFISDLESIKNKTSIPLRSIDRSRWIRIVDDLGKDSVYESSKSPFIAVRFTFQKSLISALEKLNLKAYHYDKNSKIQYFQYSEKNLYKIVNAFNNKNFDLDDQVKTLYAKISKFQKEDCLPGVYNFKIKNLPSIAIAELESTIGKPTADNLVLYKDRSLKYGLNVDDAILDVNSLQHRIAHRDTVNVSIDSKNINFDNLLVILEKLRRNKILILLSNNHQTYYDNIVNVHQYVRNLFDPKNVSVTFRLDNDYEGYEFNNYIKREKINNKVDSNTQIVYNIDNKMPKPLFASRWLPDAIVVLGSSGYVATRKVLECYPSVDLIIHLVEGNSTHGYRSYLGKGINKI